jgi:DcuC family C4-dicarboxylate transporter
MTLLLGALVVLGGIYAVYRRVDVRLALLVTSLVLGVLAADAPAIVRMFFATFSNERFVVPICTAMGFAYVLKLTGCDQHLVHLLVKPLTPVRGLLVPGTVVIGFLVNIPIVSQSSTAVTIGAVIIPILMAARIPPVTIGSALLLGSSIGGELLNPGAPELRTIVEESGKVGYQAPGLTEALVARILPLDLLGLLVATVVFWCISRRADRTAAPVTEEPVLEPAFRINFFKAMIPLLPLILLFLTAPPLKLIHVPPAWLIEQPRRDVGEAVLAVGTSTPTTPFPGDVPWGALAAQLQPADARLTAAERGLFDCRLIGAAMLIGVLAAALSAPRSSLKVAGSFFEGAGYAFAYIISLIVAANCFGKAVELIGFAKLLGDLIEMVPVVLMPIAGVLPLGFGVLCGSGMASTQSLFGFFARPALALGSDPYLVGAIVALSSAAGRTMSPFSAVALMSATMTKTDPLSLVARVALPLLMAVSAEVIVAMLMAQ